jgi:N12 class adenine-specific DNA methylase
LAILLKEGKIKRPIIIVPKQVYKNWIHEMFGYWTNGLDKSETEFEGSYFVNGAFSGTKYKLNKWFNLLNDYTQKNKLVDEYSITLITYQGLEKLGFTDNVYNDLQPLIYSILRDDNKRTERGIASQMVKSKNILGKALAKTEYDIDVMGFDYIVVDEAHNFKNVFSAVNLPNGVKDSWRIPQGSESFRGLKLFCLSLYLQNKYGGNINLLTATPFTNSPLELYSMVSLVAYNYISQSEIDNMFNFLALFIETRVEYTVNYKQDIIMDVVIKSFKNKNILRDILYRFFDYQDNPEKAGVQRPCKINMPNNSISTFLEMSETQRQAQVDANRRL